MSDINTTAEEPEVIAQCGELFTEKERMRWFRERAKEANEMGAVLCRYSVHEQIPGLVLFEAWQQRPREQGDIRWQLVMNPRQPHNGEQGS